MCQEVNTETPLGTFKQKKKKSRGKILHLAVRLNNHKKQCFDSRQCRFDEKCCCERRPNCAVQGNEIRLSVNWKPSTTASSLERVIGKEISTSSKIYKGIQKDKGTPLSETGAGRWDDTKYTSGNIVILPQIAFCLKVSTQQQFVALRKRLRPCDSWRNLA